MAEVIPLPHLGEQDRSMQPLVLLLRRRILSNLCGSKWIGPEFCHEGCPKYVHDIWDPHNQRGGMFGHKLGQWEDIPETTELWFDEDGFNTQGFDTERHDRDGFNARGADRDGFDMQGIDHDGYDREGWKNYTGFNRYNISRAVPLREHYTSGLNG